MVNDSPLFVKDYSLKPSSFLWPQDPPQLKIHHQVGMACVFYGLNALTEQLEEMWFVWPEEDVEVYNIISKSDIMFCPGR